MKRVFKTLHFGRWMRKTELTDSALCTAVHEMAQGLIDADLGGGVVKKRVVLAGRAAWCGRLRRHTHARPVRAVDAVPATAAIRAAYVAGKANGTSGLFLLSAR